MYGRLTRVPANNAFSSSLCPPPWDLYISQCLPPQDSQDPIWLLHPPKHHHLSHFFFLFYSLILRLVDLNLRLSNLINMAASDNLAAMEPGVYRPTTTFADSWISEAFARDSKALTMALQKSLSENKSSDSADSEFLPFFGTFQAATPTVSGVSGSDQETSVAAPMKRQRNAVPVSGGKVAKRKSRASKRTQTTFITADPANFRQMVQQVTGVRFNGQKFSASSVGSTIVKPEPQRPGSGGAAGVRLPTLDTSAFLFDRHQQQQRQQYQQQQVVGPVVATGGGVGPMCYGAGRVEVAEGGSVSGGGLGFDSYSSLSFPTLESWKVM